MKQSKPYLELAPGQFKKGLVSIGMPTYHGGLPYLKKAIESVLGQTYSDIELVITDNPSADILLEGTSISMDNSDSQALCEEYAKKDKRVRYVRHKEDVGVCENYNSALRESRGEYFCWVAFDDYLDKQFVEKCVALLESDKEAAIAMSDFTFVNCDKGEPTHKMDPRGYFTSERDLYSRLKKYILMYWHDGKAAIIHGLWRRAVISRDSIAEWPDGDVNFIFRGLAHGPFVFVNEVLFYKGTLPGHESRENEPLTFRRILSSLRTRFSFIQTHWINMKYIAGIRHLSYVARLELIFWECFVTLRMFVLKKY
jgi:glycosyltransferase involved in cell wall biosynthesis